MPNNCNNGNFSGTSLWLMFYLTLNSFIYLWNSNNSKFTYIIGIPLKGSSFRKTTKNIEEYLTYLRILDVQIPIIRLELCTMKRSGVFCICIRRFIDKMHISPFRIFNIRDKINQTNLYLIIIIQLL